MKWRLVWVSILLLAIVLGAVWGMRALASYYLEKGISDLDKNDIASAKHNLNLASKFYFRGNEVEFFLGKAALGRIDLFGSKLHPDADYQEAVGHFKQAIARGIESVNRAYYLNTLGGVAVSSWQLKDYQTADDFFRKWHEEYPQEVFARFFLALDDFDRNNKPDEAKELLEGALVSDVSGISAEIKNSRLYHIYTLLARVYGYYQDYPNMEKYAKLAVESAGDRKDTDVLIAHSMLAITAGKRKDFATLEAEVKTGNDLAGSPTALACPAAEGYYQGGQFDRVIAIVTAEPERASYPYSICLRAVISAYLKKGNIEKAKSYLQKYLQLTDQFQEKNIVVIRDRKNLSDAVAGVAQ